MSMKEWTPSPQGKYLFYCKLISYPIWLPMPPPTHHLVAKLLLLTTLLQNSSYSPLCCKTLPTHHFVLPDPSYSPLSCPPPLATT